MTSPTKAPSAPANQSGAPGLHQASDGRWLLQTFLWPFQILSSIENTRPVPASIALRRQRSHVRIVSGAPVFSYFSAGYARPG